MERTEHKISLISEQLGLSWAELARELHFGVDDINRIRVENPNSLLDQSSALLNLWAGREGKRAKMESLFGALKSIDRSDIVSSVECQHRSGASEEGARGWAECDPTLLSPSLINGYGLVQEELLSPASMQYSLPSPLGNEPYWQEVSSLECAPIATTEEDTLMEMSDVQVWPSGVSPSLVTVEDSSLDGSSRADDSEGATLSLPHSLGRPSSGASGASGSVMELEEEEEDEEGEIEEETAQQELAVVDRDRVRASGAVPKVNLNGQLGGQRSEGRRAEPAVPAEGSGVTGGGAVGQSSEEGLCVVTGQCDASGLSRSTEHNGDNRVVGGGAFQPYLPDKDSQHGRAGSQTPRFPRQSVATGSRVLPDAPVTQVGVDVRKGAQSVSRTSLRRVKH